MASRFLQRIAVDPGIMAGKPVIHGTRIPVTQVLQDLSEDLNVDALLEAYPRLTIDDILACLKYAAHTIQNETTSVPAHNRLTDGQIDALRSAAGAWTGFDAEEFLEQNYMDRDGNSRSQN